MSDLFNTGIRPAVDAYLQKKAEEERNYGNYWSASSAGYCMRKNIFTRMGVPSTKGIDARKTRVFEMGHIVHEYMQRITKDAGLSIAQEIELQNEDIMVRGHIDDLVLIDKHLILYDYKSQSSRSFSYQKARAEGNEVQSYYHRMQLGTYMYMMRNGVEGIVGTYPNLEEARILKISKDDLRQVEEQMFWTVGLEREIVDYWTLLNKCWADKKLPPCTCADYEGGFLAKEAYNDFFYDGEPCSLKWYQLMKKEGKINDIKST